MHGLGRNLPDTVAQKLRDRRHAWLEKLRALSDKEGKLLFERRWCTSEEVRSTYRAMRRRGWLVCFELTVLLVVMLFTVFAGYGLLVFLAGL